MNRIVLICVLLFQGTSMAQAPGPGPWNNALMIALSSDGTNFLTPTVFQDSSGVPSMARHPSGDLIAAFQWFPAPLHSRHWDSVAVKISTDNGITWSKPKPIKVIGMPVDFQRPFDPAITVTDDGKYRIYFSSGVKGSGMLSSSVNTYSAISVDGINYTFDADARFDQANGIVIDPTVIKFGNLWHYVAPKGAPQDGAYHATSTDGLIFSQQADLPSDINHNWTGNLLLESPGQVRFYGSGPKIWWSSSSDGAAWSPYMATNIQGGDPAALKVTTNQYIMVFVGKSQFVTGVDTKEKGILMAYPNPAREKLNIKLGAVGGEISLTNLTGQSVFELNAEPNSTTSVEVAAFPAGMYVLKLSGSPMTRQLVCIVH